MVKIERSDQTAGSCYILYLEELGRATHIENTARLLNICPSCYTRTWKSSTYMVNMESIRQLAAAILYLEELGRATHIVNTTRLLNICPSCYTLTWKSSTYGEYGEYQAAGSCSYLEESHILRIWKEQLAAAIPGRDAHVVK
jgi:hypothetical protein